MARPQETIYCPECNKQFTVDYSNWPRCPDVEDHRCVHIGSCSVCSAPIGYVIDDDYCTPETLVCPAHLVKP